MPSSGGDQASSVGQTRHGDPPGSSGAAALQAATPRAISLPTAVFLVAIYCVLHEAILASLHKSTDRTSYFLAGLGCFPAVYLSFRHAFRQSNRYRRRWLLWSASLAFALVEPFVAAAGAAFPLHLLSPVCLVISFTLCLLIVASPALPRTSRFIRSIDIFLAIAVCILGACALLLPDGFFDRPNWLPFLTLMRLIPATAALLAMRAAPDREEYRLMQCIALFQGASLFSAFILNQVLVSWLHRPQVFAFDFLMETPSLALALLLYFSSNATYRATGRSRFVVRSGLPLFFSLTLAGMGVWLLPTHRRVAIFGIVIAIVGYALRTTLDHSRILESEELLREDVRDLRGLANRDSLTATGNRRRFDQSLATGWSEAQIDKPLALLLVDLDFFKQINDLRGHSYGDRCLRAIAQVLLHSLPHDGAQVCRIGGDEFAILLPSTSLTNATHLATQLCAEVRDLPLKSAHGTSLTLSIGVAVDFARKAGRPAELFDEADRNLYAAKRAGRDRVQWSDAERSRLA